MATFIEEVDNPQERITPTLEQVLRKAFDAMIGDMCFTMPGTIIKYTKDKQKGDIQPDFTTKYRDGSEVDAPIIYDVPFAHQRAGSAIIHMPLEVGDKVILKFSDRSLEKWNSNGKKQNPGDVRKHHLSDCWAFPAGYPLSDTVSINNTRDIIIKNNSRRGSGRTEIRVKPDGKIQILNHQGQELVKVLDDMLTYLRQAVVYTSVGPQKLRHTQFSNVQRRLKTFLQN